MNLFSDIGSLVLSAIAQLQAQGGLPAGLDLGAVTVDPPRDPLHGDMTTNAAMVLARPAGMKPRDIAAALAPLLMADARVLSADVAGPGFLNMRLAPDVWQQVVRAVLTEGGDYGRTDLGQGARVNIEFVSANPTGPLHVGHTRGAVLGDVLASLLAHVGYDVTREYYVNDGGAQVDVLARSVYLRYLEALGKPVVFEEDTYPGEYLIEIGASLRDKVGDAYADQPESVWLDAVRQHATDAMMDLVRADLKSLGVVMDSFFSERSLYGTGRIEAAFADLDAKGLIYRGVLERPEGRTPEHWEPREQTLFRSTRHGDDVDRPIRKSDGTWTYFAPDVAYHFDKVSRGFDQLVDVLGADHGGYVKRMKAAVSALSDGAVPLDIKLCQMVRLYQNGVPFGMAQRAGSFVTLADLVERVGPDVTRFAMLTRRNDAPLDFDLVRVLEQTRDNPVFCVQYASARVARTLRQAAAAGFDVSDATLAQADLGGLSHAAQRTVARRLADWPRLIAIAARTREPHRLALYLQDLATDLHRLWEAGDADPALRMLHPDDPTGSLPKIALARAVSVVISTGLGILGVTPAEEMR